MKQLTFPFFLFASLLVIFVYVLPLPVMAEKACTCYCAVESEGATSVGDLTSASCQDTCSAAGHTVAAWACSSDALPSQNVYCFTANQCAAQKGVLDTAQPAECQPGMHYCFPKSNITVDLSVAIGALQEVGNLGEYMESVYVWMIGSAMLFAIIMVLIGGLQYVLAAGSGDVGKAKKRIMNGVVGLLLLLMSYAILYTINPQLVRLEVPTLPMIRRLSLISDYSCGYLTGDWGTQSYHTYYGAPQDSPYIPQLINAGEVPYVVQKPTDGENCGSVAEVMTDNFGADVLPEGSTCMFDYCPKVGNRQPRCVGTGLSATCVLCEAVTPANEMGVIPSEAVCGALAAADEANANGDPVTKNYCFYTQDPHMIVSGFETFLLATVPLTIKAIVAADNTLDVEEGTCASLSLSCGSVSKCEDYDNQQVKNDVTDDELDDLTPNSLAGSVNIESICSDDPCRVGAKTGTTCTYEETTAKADCISR
ncbi:hypothetical protein CO174_01480 [Candidatus Uhrbacteria bacterium CG_4_9_14_3_um_filter_50_9]|uniref:Transmembrane protein n=1 Tax=Candidatus Uhrbacteria bacterium CG_4_9_14_3_um_filter_50_9 TaxID=1975035 RepID=A0A2M7XD98_9BACT|nr:MAG: hypothetical protein CO174_01480 [Candidatus Uhrbacteria bacterium CG_4_9_14_3_um_filter_50_9]